MLNSFKKIALGGALLAASASSFAALPFTVEATNNGNPVSFQATNIAGQYNEVVLVDTNTGQFDATVLLHFTSFDNQGTVLGAGDTGLGNDYNLFAVVNFSGQATSGAPNFATDFWNGNIQLWLDPDRDSASNTPDSINDDLTTVASIGDASDSLLFDAELTYGFSDGVEGRSGSFGLGANLSDDPSTDPSLTAAGSDFFVEPDPFYNMLISFGNLGGQNGNFFDVIEFFDPASNGVAQRFSSGANVNFVPSPSGVALLGLGLLALGFRSRKA